MSPKIAGYSKNVNNDCNKNHGGGQGGRGRRLARKFLPLKENPALHLHQSLLNSEGLYPKQLKLLPNYY